MKNIFILLIFLPIVLSSCRSYSKAENLKKGQKIVEVQNFDKLFSTQYETVGYLRGIGDDYIWLSASSLYDRYIIKFSFPLKSPYDVIKDGAIRVTVNEMDTEEEHGGRIVTRTLFTLSESQWEKVQNLEDIFILAEVEAKKKSPVEGFETIPPRNW